VYEPSQSKGGGTLELLRSECPDDLRTPVFGDEEAEREVLQYVRLAAFQRATICRVLGRMLLAMPKYSSHHQRSLNRRPKSRDTPQPDATPAVAAQRPTGWRAVQSLTRTMTFMAVVWPKVKAEVKAEARVQAEPSSSSKRRPRGEVEPPELYVEESILARPLQLDRPISLWVSECNLGAIEIATMMKTMLGWRVTVRSNPTQQDMMSPAAFFLLLLNESTFSGSAAESETLREHVRGCLQAGRPHALVLLHWTEVQFEHFFTCTPTDLLLGGIYHNLAVPLFPPGPQQPVSLATIAMRLGATADHSYLGAIRRSLSRTIFAPEAGRAVVSLCSQSLARSSRTRRNSHSARQNSNRKSTSDCYCSARTSTSAPSNGEEEYNRASLSAYKDPVTAESVVVVEEVQEAAS
jgi:hypothetical protein